MIPFSCSDYTFPLLSPVQRFALLKLLGFQYVDIGLFERSSGLTPSLLCENPLQFTEELKRNLDETKLQVTDIFLQTGVDPEVAAANDPDPAVRSRNREMFRQTINLCKKLGCPHITGLPGVWHHAAKDSGDLARAIEEAAWRQCVSADAGVCYAIEAHVGSLCDDVASTLAFVDAVPGLTLTLDYGHFVFAGIPSDKVHSLVRCASHIHARGGARNRLQTPVTENEIDFAGMMRCLYETKYRGAIALEYVWIDWNGCNRTDNVSETILLRHQLAQLGERSTWTS